MLAYYGSRISENMTVTPEGYLICRHVPIARTGTQEYNASELGAEGDAAIIVNRSPDEVFSDAALASFEGKPVTNGHPPESVLPENFAAYAKGHVQNVRRGLDAESDLMLADLFINDPGLIERINGGLREVSCGYNCDYIASDHGYEQLAIRGNHVAVVEKGRAGDRVAIRDNAAQTPVRATLPQPERRKVMTKRNANNKRGLLALLLRVKSNDAEPEEVAELAEALIEESESSIDETPAAEHPKDNEPQPSAPVGDEMTLERLALIIEGVNEKVGTILARMSGDSKDEPDALEILEKEASVEKMDEEAAAAPADEEPIKTDSESETVSSDETQESATPNADASAISAAIAVIKPVIAKLPEVQRRAASDEAAKALRQAFGINAKPSNAYARINRERAYAMRANRASDSAQDQRQVGRDIMKARNPHYKAE
jgi:hypothetical protein